MKNHGSSHKKCVGLTVAVLFLLVAGTSWLGYVDPSIVEAYGLRAELFQYNWVIFPLIVTILGSILVVTRTQSIPEHSKCIWIVCMALLFPFATFALIVRLLWSMPNVNSLATIEEDEHRLELLYVPVGRGGLDFHALRWSKKDEIVCEISKKDFQHGSPDRRWISGLAKFDPNAGTAIVQVGLLPSDSNTVEYSWREWILKQNQGGQILRLCDNPWDKFDSSAH